MWGGGAQCPGAVVGGLSPGRWQAGQVGPHAARQRVWKSGSGNCLRPRQVHGSGSVRGGEPCGPDPAVHGQVPQVCGDLLGGVAGVALHPPGQQADQFTGPGAGDDVERNARRDAELLGAGAEDLLGLRADDPGELAQRPSVALTAQDDPVDGPLLLGALQPLGRRAGSTVEPSRNLRTRALRRRRTQQSRSPSPSATASAPVPRPSPGAHASTPSGNRANLTSRRPSQAAELHKRQAKPCRVVGEPAAGAIRLSDHN